MQWITNLFENMTIRTKLTVSFIIMIAFMAIIGMVGFSSMTVIRGQMEDIFKVRMPGIDFLIEADRDLQQLLVAERSMIFAELDSDTYKGFMGDYEENFQQSAQRWAKYKALAFTPEEKKIIPQFEAARNKWEAITRKVWDYRGNRTPEGRQMAIALTLGEASQAFEGMRDYLDQLTEINLNLAHTADKNAEDAYGKTVTMLLAITALGFLAGIIFAFVSIRGVSVPLKKVVDFAGELRKGDLSVNLKEGNNEIGRMSHALNRVVEELRKKTEIATAISTGDLRQEVSISSERDVFGKALQSMVWRLNDVVQKLHNAANQVDGGAQQVSESSQTLSQGATEQASSLQEITSSMTEINSQTRTNAENAGKASELASDAKQSAETGVSRMMEMTRSMETISESSQEIGKIIKVIDDIAFQTNLLALNAAVESARAGIHGKGFAVVAQEVRTLASRSAKAAQGITDLIDNAVNNIKDGTQIAEGTSTALDEINARITKASDLVMEIAAASNEQAKGIAQVNQGLSQIDSVTQQNAANAEETSASSEELSAQAASLRKALTFFKVKGQTVGRAVPDFSSEPQQAHFQNKPQARKQPAIKAPAPQKDTGWGNPGKSSMEVDPGQVIALDDDEFGKF